MSLPVQITVGAGGTNPTPGSTLWSNPSIAGQLGWIEKSGYGPLRFEDYSIIPGGGVQLLNGLAFGATGEVYFWNAVGLAYDSVNSTYTNGFNYTSVLNALMGRIGFRPHTEAEYAALVDSTNQLSKSYRYYNDFHALVSAANIKAVQSDPAIGDIAFNAYLQSLQKAAIMRALNGIFSEKEYIEQVLTFDREENGQDQLLPNESKFVGFEIKVAERADISVQIDGANLLFDSNITGLTLYLFKDGKKSPIWSTQVNVVAYENTQVTFSDVILNYITSTTKGQRYFFGYFQDDLGAAKAVRQAIDWEDDTIAFCAMGMSSNKISGQTDFNRSQISYMENSFGVNLEISSFRDWTNTIVKKPNLFDEAIGLTMAATVLEQVIYSIRSNQTERILRAGISEAVAIQDLTGSAPVSDGPPPVLGLKQRLERELKRVKSSLFEKDRATVVNLT